MGITATALSAAWRRCTGRLALILALLASLPGNRLHADASGDAAASIRHVVETGEHAWLRWPRFPDYQAQVWRLYDGRGFQPLWIENDRPIKQTIAVIESLAGADRRGLHASDYDAEKLATAVKEFAEKTPTSEQMAWFDTAMTVSVMRFVSDSYVGRIHPRILGFGLDMEPKKLDLPLFLQELVRAEAPAERIDGLDPPFQVVKGLQAALPAVRALAARADLPVIPNVKKLRVGEKDQGISAIRQLLILLGDLPEGSRLPEDLHRYDSALAAAVKSFQSRHGLEADGVIGTGTLRAMQVPLSMRVTQIELALERLRWLPVEPADRVIIVNLPEFRLRAYDKMASGPRLEMGVVVGSVTDKHQTPVLQADMKYLVFRPYWIVPNSIMRKEILPKLDEDPTYLERQSMEVVRGRIRQRPGKSNSLGLIKFIFPNPHHVYLHDTPSKSLFSRQRRDFSHGCIRVSDPVSLAEFVMAGAEGWDRKKIQDMMQRGKDNRRVDLATPIPVFLLYSTATIREDGRPQFFEDIYGYDAKLVELLAKGYPYPTPVPTRTPSLTPSTTATVTATPEPTVTPSTTKGTS